MDITKEIIQVFFIAMGVGFLVGLTVFVATSTYIKLSNIFSKKITVTIKKGDDSSEKLTLSKAEMKGFKIAMKKLADTEVESE